MVTVNVNAEPDALSSAGHRLGQLVGDWWEGQVIYPLLQEVARELGLYLDNRLVSRTCRFGKILWKDDSGNDVDYDYVLELGGTQERKGVPVGFLESFWRRGARHSKDKARDDTNKLLPMRDTYPTARFLAIAACGEFTAPAKDYVTSRNVELFFISKEKIIDAFATIGAVIDYRDTLPEAEKLLLVRDLEKKFTPENQRIVAHNLRNAAGELAFASFKQRIIGSLMANPQEIRIYALARCGPVVFDNIDAATTFLNSQNPEFPAAGEAAHYEYEVSFSDGSDFFRELDSLEEVRKVNEQLLALVKHFSALVSQKSAKPVVGI